MFYLIGLVTGIISFFIGCIWYTALFGKAWQRGMGFSDEKVKTIFVPRRIIVAVLFELIAALCTVAHSGDIPPAIPAISPQFVILTLH